MSAIAKVLAGMGHVVSGSDQRGGSTLDRLADFGVAIHRGHHPEVARAAIWWSPHQRCQIRIPSSLQRRAPACLCGAVPTSLPPSQRGSPRSGRPEHTGRRRPPRSWSRR